MLTQSQALEQLRGMTAATVEPVLSDTDLIALLGRAAVPDAGGSLPGDAGWTPTYSPVFLNAAAAEGWRWKAGRLTHAKSGNKGDDSFQPELQRADMLALAEDYQRRVSGTQQVQPFGRLRDDAITGAGWS